MSCGCSIVTGYAVSPMSNCPPMEGRLLQSPGKNILFSPDTPQGTIFSPSITVTPGKCVLIDAYNMPKDQPIYVNRIVKSTSGPVQVDMCDPCAIKCAALGAPGTIMFRERMRMGCTGAPWQLLNSDQTVPVIQLLVAVPGTYELELSDTNMLGDMEVEYVGWDLSLTPYLPKDYFAGVCSGATIGG